jgi:DNA-directed RNA polymerase subunit RPC12/RpoP
MKCLECNTEMNPSCIDDQGEEDIFITQWECPKCGYKRIS